MTNYLLTFDLSFKDLVKSFYYSSLNSLPILLPICVCFSLFFIYNKLSYHFEILALRSLGFSFIQIAFPALLFGSLIGLFSVPVSFYLAPWGHKKLELLIDGFKFEKKNLNIRSNVFAENIFDFVIYANSVDKEQNELKEVFLYDETRSPWPLTIVAQKAKLLATDDQYHFLRLSQGSIHRTTKSTHTKVDFSSYDVYFPFVKKSKDRLHPSSYNIKEIRKEISQPLPEDKGERKRRRRFEIAYYYFFNYPIAVLIFTLLGFSLGTFYVQPLKVNGFLLCAFLVAIYWVSYSSSLSLGKHKILLPILSASLTNILFLIPVYFSLRRLKG